MITVVCGPPCAGKSTYVREHAAAGDVIVDLDLIAVALGGSPFEHAPGLWEVAQVARSAAVDRVLRGVDVDAWIIHTQPRAYWLRRYRLAGAAMVTVDPGRDICVARAQAQQRPGFTLPAIDKWYASSGEYVRADW